MQLSHHSVAQCNMSKKGLPNFETLKQKIDLKKVNSLFRDRCLSRALPIFVSNATVTLLFKPPPGSEISIHFGRRNSVRRDVIIPFGTERPHKYR